MCHTSDICVLCMVTSVTWSWPWTELNIKHLLNQCLALYFRSTRGKFWPKTDNFEVSTARNLKAPILTFDLTLTWHVTSFGKFRGCFRIVSSRAFERRIVRLSAAIRSGVMTWGRLTPPPPSKSRVAKYPSKCRVKDRANGTWNYSSLSSSLEAEVVDKWGLAPFPSGAEFIRHVCISAPPVSVQFLISFERPSADSCRDSRSTNSIGLPSLKNADLHAENIIPVENVSARDVENVLKVILPNSSLHHFSLCLSTLLF